MTTLCAPMKQRIALITTLLALALATPAAAQQNPFGPLPQAAPTDTPAPNPTSTSDDNSTGRTTLFIIGGALVLGFGFMGWFILRDARSSLPEDEVAALSRLREQGPHAHKRQAKAKARAKGRSQRNARKHNRPRRG
jgi:hypothetical protein